jgi:hypothetical protein
MPSRLARKPHRAFLNCRCFHWVPFDAGNHIIEFFLAPLLLGNKRKGLNYKLATTVGKFQSRKEAGTVCFLIQNAVCESKLKMLKGPQLWKQI